MAMGVAALVWLNYRFAMNAPGGIEFASNWLGFQTLLKKGGSPYGEETARAVQNMMYGHVARGNEVALRVTAPIYALLFFFPFSLIADFALARALWMVLLECALLFLAFLSLRLVEWRPKPVILALYLVFCVFWYHAVWSLIDGSLSILAALAVTGALLALKNRFDELAGVLLALATIRIEAFALLLVLIFYWALRNRRWQVIFWFWAVFALLMIAGILIMPDWILQNLISVVQYLKFARLTTFREALMNYVPGIGGRIGLVMSYVLALMLLLEWSFGVRARFRGFVWTVCLTLLAGLWIGIPTSTNNFVVLIPALALVFSLWEERWRKVGTGFVLVSMLLLLAGGWALFLDTYDIVGQSASSAMMYFPLPVYLYVFLYWVRWWAFQPPRVWLDEISELEQAKR